jgi:G3E family GTPase
MATIPLNLVNGFLGSGKTTFLLHYLNSLGADRKIGVIQNEFSSSGTDGITLRNNRYVYRMLEINNGSVFCVCLLGSFVESLSEFIADFQPDEVIMEASGMSDPVSIGQIFQSLNLKNRVYLNYAWTIVDALNFYKVAALRSRLEHQIRVADTVIVNKCDLAEEAAEQVVADTGKINPFAVIEKTSFAKSALLQHPKPFRVFPFQESLESCRPDLQSVVIKTHRLIHPDGLDAFFKEVQNDFIRMKGFVNTGKDMKLAIQGVFGDFHMEEVNYFAGATELVGIGHFDSHKNYTLLFENHCQ